MGSLLSKAHSISMADLIVYCYSADIWCVQ